MSSVPSEIACGKSIRAWAAGPPSPREPGVPLPATVAIVVSEPTLRSVALPASAISTPPSRSGSTAVGVSSDALRARPPSPR